jgi:hypothetical protein
MAAGLGPRQGSNPGKPCRLFLTMCAREARARILLPRACGADHVQQPCQKVHMNGRPLLLFFARRQLLLLSFWRWSGRRLAFS